jgi:dolichol-phosphate mannosyltransferase
MELSIVIPYYGCDSSLSNLCERLYSEIKKIHRESEVIFVLDGPEGGSWELLEKTTNQYGFKCIKLIHNFGQHAATKAGLSIAKGKVVVTIDCDLQDPPELISSMLNEMTHDIDVIYAKRLGDYDGKSRHLARKIAQKLLKKIYPNTFDLDIGSFMLLRKKVVEQILAIDSPDHVGLIVNWMQFPSKTVNYQREIRKNGQSSYNSRKLISHGLEALNFDLSYFFKVSIITSLLFSSLSVTLGIVSLIRAIFLNTSPGWASLFVMVAIGFSLTLTLLSLVGYSIAKNEKNGKKPQFIIAERDE